MTAPEQLGTVPPPPMWQGCLALGSSRALVAEIACVQTAGQQVVARTHGKPGLQIDSGLKIPSEQRNKTHKYSLCLSVVFTSLTIMCCRSGLLVLVV